MGTYLGMREAGAPLATSGSNADCPLPLLSWRLWERAQKPVVVWRQQRQGLPSQPWEKTPSRWAQQRESKKPVTQYPRTEVFPIHILLWIFPPPGPVLTDSHPELPPPRQRQLHQLPARQSSFDVTKSLLKSIIISQKHFREYQQLSDPSSKTRISHLFLASALDRLSQELNPPSHDSVKI